MSALAYRPVHELVAGIDVGELGPVAIIEAYLDRIEAHEAKLRAFVEVYAEEARALAEAAETSIARGHRVGPLHGIPVAVKDIVDIEGRVTTGGSMVWRERRSPATATLVRRLIEAGMIVLGKTHTVEFAMGGWGTNQQMGTPWNPWDLDVHRTPGGSSAGTGVSVAAGLAPWGIGTDTGGSVRLPAGWCGLAGLKTTIGRISTYGVMPLAATLDTPGPLTRSVEDAALLFDLLQGPDPRDPKTRGLPPADTFTNLKRGVCGMRLGIMPESERSGVNEDVLAAFDASVETFVDLGAEVVPVPELPCTFADFAELTGKIIYSEGYSVVGDLCDQPELPLDEDVRPRILIGKQYSAREYLDALAERERIKTAFADALDELDGLLTPTIATPAVPLNKVDQTSTPALFTRAFNLLDCCALTVPNGLTRDELPSGLQIAAKPYDEATALRVGWAYEQATEWHRAHPPGLPAG